jgi:hypothetical protein
MSFYTSIDAAWSRGSRVRLEEIARAEEVSISVSVVDTLVISENLFGAPVIEHRKLAQCLGSFQPDTKEPIPQSSRGRLGPALGCGLGQFVDSYLIA